MIFEDLPPESFTLTGVPTAETLTTCAPVQTAHAAFMAFIQPTATIHQINDAIENFPSKN